MTKMTMTSHHVMQKKQDSPHEQQALLDQLTKQQIVQVYDTEAAQLLQQSQLVKTIPVQNTALDLSQLQQVINHVTKSPISPSKEVKCEAQGRARLRSSSDGCRYSRRGDGLSTNSSSSSSSSSVLFNPKSVLKRPVSMEELQRPGGPYIRKTFTIMGDAVGWGFVVRGNKPCHIQAVEPSGPAAAAGMKVCQFVVSVNGINVLNLDYRTVSHLILTGPRTVVMEVMEETDN
ncbi:DEP domain-containing mTOR-interacting protein-like [Notolabrus celidotus]|uniref:DEP domain-containing mTOR-interacting protein-like n=1 Tax=Notolabrus celidotus TaxID=1203425 RepID=UPI0014905E52|nr:DEP domain-containing mTOR-interacting protein-like [Notolabrus celidotus]